MRGRRPHAVCHERGCEFCEERTRLLLETARRPRNTEACCCNCRRGEQQAHGLGPLGEEDDGKLLHAGGTDTFRAADEKGVAEADPLISSQTNAPTGGEIAVCGRVLRVCACKDVMKLEF